MNAETLDPVRLQRVERSLICNFALALGVGLLILWTPFAEALSDLRQTFLP